MRKDFKDIVFYSVLFLFSFSQFAFNAANTPEAQKNLKIIVDAADQFSPVTDFEEEKPFGGAVKYFSADDGAGISALNKDEQTALLEAVNILCYGLFSGIKEISLDSKESAGVKTKRNLLKIIDLLSQNTVFPNNYSGRKKKLAAILKTYQTAKPEQITKLIQDNEKLGSLEKTFLSPKEILGTGFTLDSESFLNQLIAERMQDSESEFQRTDPTDSTKIKTIQADSEPEEPSKSWKTLRTLIEQTKVQMLKYAKDLAKDEKDVISFCEKLNEALDKPISFDERIAALKAKVNDGVLSQDCIDLNKILQRAIKSLSQNIDKNKRQELVKAAKVFIAKNALDLTTVKTVGIEILNAFKSLSSGAFNFEILKDQAPIFLQIYDPVNTKEKFLAKSNLLTATASRRGISDALAITPYLIGEKVIFEVMSPNPSKELKYTFLSILGNKLAIQSKDFPSKLADNNAFKQAKNAEEKLTAWRNYIGVVNPEDYEFKIYGSANKVSIELDKDDSFLTSFLDGSFGFKTADGTAVTLTTDADGNLIQPIRNCFKVVVASEVAKMITDGFIENYEIIPATSTTAEIIKLKSERNLKALELISNCLAKIFSASEQNQAKNQADKTANQSGTIDVEDTKKLISEILFFLQAVTLVKEDYDVLKKSENAKSLDDVITLLDSQAFANVKTSNTEIAESLKNIIKIWATIKTTDFIDDVPNAGTVSYPQNDQTVVLQVIADNNSRFLVIEQSVGVNKDYELYSKESLATDPDAFFNVVRVKSIFGLKTKVAGQSQEIYLTAKENLVGADQNNNLSDLIFTGLPKVKKDSNDTVVFQNSVNNLQQLNLEYDSDKKGFYISIKIKKEDGSFTPYYLAEGDARKDKNNVRKIVLSSSGSSKLLVRPIVITAFLSKLKEANLNPDEKVKLQTFNDLLDAIASEDELAPLLSSLKDFLIKISDTAEEWNSFISDATKYELMNAFMAKLEKLTLKSENVRALKSDLILLAAGRFSHTELMNNLLDKNVVISWQDSSKNIRYLKAATITTQIANQTKSSTTLNFSATSPADTGSGFIISKKTNSSYVIKSLGAPKGSEFLKFDKTTGAISFAEEAAASEIVMVGTLNAIAFKTISTSQNEVERFLGIKKTFKDELSFFEGTKNNNVAVPLPMQQLFSIRIQKDLEKNLMNTKAAFDLSSVKSFNEDIKTKVTTLLAGFQKVVAEATMNQAKIAQTPKDLKMLLCNEVKLLLISLTTKSLDLYKAIMEDSQLKNLIENDIVAALSLLAGADTDILAKQAECAKIWKDGFSGESPFKDDDVVSLQVNIGDSDKANYQYASITEVMFEGKKYLMPQMQPTELAKTSLFKIKVYQNKIMLSPLSNPDKYLCAEIVLERTKSRKVLTRLTIDSLPANIKAQDIDFSQPSMSKFLFVFDKPDNTKDSEPGILQISLNDPNETKDDDKKIKTSNIICDNEDNLFLKLAINSYSKNSFQNFSILKKDPVHTRLVEVMALTEPTDALAGFLGLLQDNYFNTKDQAKLFTNQLESTFIKFRSNEQKWNLFLSSSAGKDIIAKFIDAVSKQSETIFEKALKTQALAAIKGDASIDLKNVIGKNIIVIWHNPVDDKDYFMVNTTSVTDENEASKNYEFKFTNQDSKLDSKAQFILKNSAAENEAIINDGYFLGLDEKINLIDNDGKIEGSSSGKIAKFSISGGTGKTYFVQASEGSKKQLLLSVDPETMAPVLREGVMVSDSVRPTAFQSFTVLKLTDFEKQLAETSSLDASKVLNRIAAYQAMIEDMTNNPSEPNLKALIKAVENFVMEYTKNQDKYNKLNTNEAKAALMLMLDKLQKASTSNDLISKVQAIRTAWNDGFWQEPSDKAPTAGNIVLIKDIASGKFLQIQDTASPDGAITQLKLGSSDQLDINSHFVVHVYKNKFGFEPKTKNQLYLKNPAPSQDTAAIANRLTASFLEKDNNSNTTDFSAAINKSFHFILEQTKEGFRIKALDRNVDIVLDQKDNSFARSFDTKVDEKATPLICQFVIVSNLHQKLMAIKDTKIDKEALAGFYAILQQNFISNKTNASLFGAGFEQFVRQKQASAEAWTNFVGSEENAAIIKQIFDYMKSNKNFTENDEGNLPEKLELIVSKGFSEGLKDKDFIIIRAKFGNVNLPSPADIINMISPDSSDYKSGMISANSKAAIEKYLNSPNINILNTISSASKEGKTSLLQELKDAVQENSIGKLYATFRKISSYNTVKINAIAMQSAQGTRFVAKCLDEKKDNTDVANAIFFINQVTQENQQYVQIKWNSGKEEYVLLVKDTLGSNPTKVNAEFVLANTISSPEDKLRSYFETQGNTAKMAFKSAFSKGFLTRLQDGSLATVNDQKKLAGVMVGKLLSPGQTETFSIEILSQTSKDLLAYSNPQVQLKNNALDAEATSAKIAESITNFQKYPAAFFQMTNMILKSNDSEKTKYLEALKTFVNNVSNSKDLSSNVGEKNDQEFLDLISSLGDLELSKDQQILRDAILSTWFSGYQQAHLELSAPADGSTFIWMLTKPTGIANNETNMNLVFQKNNWIPLMAIKDGRENVYRLGTAELNDGLQGLPNDEAKQDKFMMLNDPLDKNSLFKMVVYRNDVGVVSQEAGSKMLIIDDINFADAGASDQSTGAYSFEKWQKSRAYFGGSSDFKNPNSDVNTHFVISGNKIGFTFQQKTDNSFLGADRDDGFVRSWTVQSTETSAKKTITKALKIKDANSTTKKFTPKFLLIEFKEFHNQLLTAKNAKTEQEAIDGYKKAMGLISEQMDVDLFAGELIRFVVRRKVNKQTWDEFVAKKEVVDSLTKLIADFKNTFDAKNKNNMTNTTYSDLDIAMLNQQVLYVTGKRYPLFVASAAEIASKNEVDILTFEQERQNLVAKLGSLTPDNAESFVNDLQKLFARRTELDISEIIDTTNPKNLQDTSDATKFAYAQTTVANWVEFQVAENEILRQNNTLQNTVKELANKFRADYSFVEIYNNLSNMLSTIPSFSNDRSMIFMQQLAKACSEKGLKKALDEGFIIDDLKTMIRKAMANQLKPVLELDYDATKLPQELGTGAKYKDRITSIVNTLDYPLAQIKGALFIEWLTTRISTLSTADFKKTEIISSVNQLAKILEKWEAGLTLTEEQAIAAKFTYKSGEKIIGSPSAAKKFYASKMIPLVDKFVALMVAKGFDQAVVTKVKDLLLIIKAASSATTSVTTTTTNTTQTTASNTTSNTTKTTKPATLSGLMSDAPLLDTSSAVPSTTQQDTQPTSGASQSLGIDSNLAPTNSSNSSTTATTQDPADVVAL